MVNRLVELQRLWVDRVEELLALGLPDWRAQGWVPRSPTSYSGRATKISANDRAMLADFVRRLFNRLDDVDTCWSTATFIQAMSAAMPGNDIAGLAGRRPAGGHLWKRSRQHRAFRAGHHRADPAMAEPDGRSRAGMDEIRAKRLGRCQTRTGAVSCAEPSLTHRKGDDRSSRRPTCRYRAAKLIRETANNELGTKS